MLALLISKLVLVDALRAPTAELWAQHRYKTFVVDRSAISSALCPQVREYDDTKALLQASGRAVGLRCRRILGVGTERDRGLRDTR